MAKGDVIKPGFDGGDAKRVLWSFLYGFIAFVAIQAPGLFSARNYSEGKALLLGLLAGAFAAGCSAVKNYLAGPKVK